MNREAFIELLTELYNAKLFELVRADIIEDYSRDCGSFERDPIGWFLDAGDNQQRAVWEMVQRRASEAPMLEKAA